MYEASSEIFQKNTTAPSNSSANSGVVQSAVRGLGVHSGCTWPHVPPDNCTAQIMILVFVLSNQDLQIQSPPCILFLNLALALFQTEQIWTN
jgi:hypothetical protein